MYMEVRDFALRKIKDAPLTADPFPHFFIQDIFPPAFYERLLTHLPPETDYEAPADLGGITGTRRIFPCDRGHISTLSEKAQTFWLGFIGELGSQGAQGVLLAKFKDQIAERFANLRGKLNIDTSLKLSKDYAGCSLGPHTDHPERLITLFFYLPRDESLKTYGTSIYTPKKAGFTCNGGAHHPVADFEVNATMPFQPNSCFGFFKTNHSFHGIGAFADEAAQRDMLICNINIIH